jgi:hypothetical protein
MNSSHVERRFRFPFIRVRASRLSGLHMLCARVWPIRKRYYITSRVVVEFSRFYRFYFVSRFLRWCVRRKVYRRRRAGIFRLKTLSIRTRVQGRISKGGGGTVDTIAPDGKFFWNQRLAAFFRSHRLFLFVNRKILIFKILHSDHKVIHIFPITLSTVYRVKFVDNKYYLSWKSYAYTCRGGNKTVAEASKLWIRLSTRRARASSYAFVRFRYDNIAMFSENEKWKTPWFLLNARRGRPPRRVQSCGRCARQRQSRPYSNATSNGLHSF